VPVLPDVVGQPLDAKPVVVIFEREPLEQLGDALARCCGRCT
jgi:hypothetical protein